MSDNIAEPTWPKGTRVRVSWSPIAPDGYTGKIDGPARWTAIGWEARVRRDGKIQWAKWVPADRVTEISAVEQLGDLAP